MLQELCGWTRANGSILGRAEAALSELSPLILSRGHGRFGALSRLVIMLFDADGLPIVVAKIPRQLEGEEHLRREYSLLQSLQGTPAATHTPAGVWLPTLEGRLVLVEAVIPGHSAAVQLSKEIRCWGVKNQAGLGPIFAKHLQAVRLVTDSLWRTPVSPTVRCLGTERILGQIKETASRLESTIPGVTVAALKASDWLETVAQLEPVLIHGDLVPGNLMLSGGQAGLVDWEWVAATPFPGHDLLRFLLYYAHQVNGLLMEDSDARIAIYNDLVEGKGWAAQTVGAAFGDWIPGLSDPLQRRQAWLLTLLLEIGLQERVVRSPSPALFSAHSKELQSIVNANRRMIAAQLGGRLEMSRSADPLDLAVPMSQADSPDLTNDLLDSTSQSGSAAKRGIVRLCRLLAQTDRIRLRKLFQALRRGEISRITARIRSELGLRTDSLSTAVNLEKALSLLLSEPLEPESMPPVVRFADPIDIVIPVYNGYEYLEPLFEHLLAHTSEPYRLIILDDCSLDPRVWPYLQAIAERRPNTILLRNEVNCGFVATVNRGLRCSQQHVVILNTDVEVPPGWLERLMGPIICDPDLASTTPFTNAGTICSFPTFMLDNEPFDRLSVAEVDRTFGRVKAAESSITIPTGVGFCMGMNRKALAEIGLFDELSFSKGYGEENDWCCRAVGKGYRNQMVCNLFVHHRHGGSFPSREKARLIERNGRVLGKKHPNYHRQVAAFVAQDPAAPLRSILLLLLAGRRENPDVILVVDHALGGGANRYRKQRLQEWVGQGHLVLLYTENRLHAGAKLVGHYKQHLVEFSVQSIDQLLLLANHIPIRQIFYNNAVAHHNPLRTVQTLASLRSRANAHLTVAVHDYFPICPSYTLLNWQGVYCQVPEIGQCSQCLWHNPFADSVPEAQILMWRNAWGQLLRQAEQVLCFSQSSAEIVARAYPHLDSRKIVIQPHRPEHQLLRKPRLSVSPDLRIGVVGAINFQKGLSIVRQLARLLKERHLPGCIHVIGELAGEAVSDGIHVTGPYRPEELPDRMEALGLNIFLFPSICPETFSYVTDELMQMEVPVVAFNLGAPAERLSRYAKGLLVTEVSAEAALDGLVALHRSTQGANQDQFARSR